MSWVFPVSERGKRESQLTLGKGTHYFGEYFYRFIVSNYSIAIGISLHHIVNYRIIYATVILMQ